jgi:tetratricopeptide (TPR) repeat protein
MNPLELVAKTLYSFDEKELTTQLLLAFGKRAETFEQYNDVAKICFEIKDFSNAILYGEKSLKLAQTKEEKYTTSKNLINVYNQSNHPEKSITQIEKCKKVNPLDPELLLEETFAYSALNQKEKSEKLLFNLIQRKLPEEIERKAFHNLSGHYFRKDDIHTGLQHFLKAGEVEAYKNRKLPNYEKWDGTITQGRTIIIDNECGAGDEVVHIRFMKHLKELGMKPIWSSTRKELVELFNYNGFTSVCTYDKITFPKDACWVYGLALPYYLNLELKDLGTDHYLKTLPEYDKKWEWMKEDTDYKIGIFWASSSGFEQNSFRSVELKDYMSVLGGKGHSLYSLQTYTDNKDADKYPEIKQSLSVQGREFADTFSIIKNLDMVVTSCSFVAHVAASLGKEVCVFVPIMEYYVWTSSTGKCMWYGDNVHLFRQKKPRTWDAPIKQFGEFINGL